MKKTVISVLCVILVFIPTFIAIASYIMTQNAPLSNGFVERIDISDFNGKTSTVTKTKSEGDLVTFFVKMNSRAVKVAELPEPLKGTPFYKVTFHSGNFYEDYKYYFNTNGTLSYAEYPDGTVYQLDVADVNKFLVTPYALSLYSEEDLPVLKTAGKENIKPAKVNWKYKLDGQNYSTVSGFDTTDEIITYDMEGSIQLLFSSDADLYTVKAYDANSAVIFDAAIDDISDLVLGAEKNVTIMITASWYEDNTRDYYGEATYNFKASLVDGAEFYIGSKSNDIVQGDFVAITGYNISDPSNIGFTSQPSINFDPVFYQNGDSVVAFVPISMELDAGSYVFTLTYGAIEQNINLEVGEKNFKRRNHTVSKLIAEKSRSEAAMDEFNTLYNEICAESESEMLFDGDFIDYEAVKSMKASVSAGYGLYRTVTSTKEVYRNIGVEWKMSEGTEITATNSGKVVYTGITSNGGRMVVIDHGMGLKTWYMHMGEIKASVGDIVAKGQVIGTAGASGFTEQMGVYTIMTIGNVPVCPYRAWDTGVGIDIYSK